MIEDSDAARVEDARQLWALLAAEGKAPTDLERAAHGLPRYSVAVEPWLDRLAKRYLRGLCRAAPHFKLAIAPYGGGKTHFLLALAVRARRENFAVSYVPCGADVSLDDPLALYVESVKRLWLPGEAAPGMRNLLDRAVRAKREDIARHGAPDAELVLDRWIDALRRRPFPENAFGRAMAEALRSVSDPLRAPFGDAAVRWLQGDAETLDPGEMRGLRLAKTGARDRKRFGRNLLLSLVEFLPETGAHGLVLTMDEVETLFNARGRALQRVLAAMRVLVDAPQGVTGGLPLFGVFAAVPDILEQMGAYPALQQRFAVLGAPFEDGNDFAAQLRLERMGEQEPLLAGIGRKLIGLGRLATGASFDAETQSANAEALARVAVERNLEVDARRLYVKTWVSLLEEQGAQGERKFEFEELSKRYQGAFGSVLDADDGEFEP